MHRQPKLDGTSTWWRRASPRRSSSSPKACSRWIRSSSASATRCTTSSGRSTAGCSVWKAVAAAETSAAFGRHRQSLRGLLAQFHLLDLPRAGHREVVDEHDSAWDLEARDSPATVREDIVLGHDMAGLAANERHADLAESRVRVADDRRETDARVTHQERLDLHGVDVLAADLQHVLVAAHEAQMSVVA